MKGILLLYLAVGFSLAVGLAAGHGLSETAIEPVWLADLAYGAVVGAVAFYTLALVISFQEAHLKRRRGPIVLGQALLLAINWGLPEVIAASALAGISLFAALGGMLGSVTPPFAKGQTPRQSTTGALAGSITGGVAHLAYRFFQ